MKQPALETRRRIGIWTVVLLPLLAILATTAYLAVAQPGCVACHSKNSDFATATAQATHPTVQCVACHVSPAPVDRYAFGFHQLVGMVLPLTPPQSRDRASVADARCLACHEAIQEEVVTANGIRIDHASCAVDAQCTDCHSEVGHGAATRWVRTYDMETCLGCHADGASTKCDTCHVEKDREARVTTGVFAITHGTEWRTTHGMGNSATCSVCHTAAKCEKCHGVGLPHDKAFMEKHAVVAADPRAKCFTCHEKSFCADCHGTDMPHSKEFTRNHAARAQSDPRSCKRCHADPDCSGCHVKHVHPGGAIDTLPNPLPPVQGGG
ncbi:MAG: hypothetical protein WCI74_10760 [Actinomycetes bacterium]